MKGDNGPVAIYPHSGMRLEYRVELFDSNGLGCALSISCFENQTMIIYNTPESTIMIMFTIVRSTVKLQKVASVRTMIIIIALSKQNRESFICRRLISFTRFLSRDTFTLILDPHTHPCPQATTSRCRCLRGIRLASPCLLPIAAAALELGWPCALPLASEKTICVGATARYAPKAD